MKSAFVVILAAALCGCAGRARQVQTGSQPAPQPPVTIVMENRNWATVNVFAVRDGSWARLGLIPTNGRESAVLPHWAMSGTGFVQLKVEAVGSRESYLTDPIMVTWGQQLVLYVQPAMRMTSWAVR